MSDENNTFTIEATGTCQMPYTGVSYKFSITATDKTTRGAIAAVYKIQEIARAKLKELKDMGGFVDDMRTTLHTEPVYDRNTQEFRGYKTTTTCSWHGDKIQESLEVFRQMSEIEGVVMEPLKLKYNEEAAMQKCFERAMRNAITAMKHQKQVVSDAIQFNLDAKLLTWNSSRTESSGKCLTFLEKAEQSPQLGMATVSKTIYVTFKLCY